MYQVTLKYYNTTVTRVSESFDDALESAWMEMFIIALTKHNAINDAALALSFCREDTRIYCKILGGAQV